MPPGTMEARCPRVHSVNPVMRVVALVIPVFLATVVAYELYLVAEYVLMEQIYRRDHNHSLGLGLLISYAVIATLMVLSYLRTFAMIRINPGVVPLGDEWARDFYGAQRIRDRPSPGRHAGANRDASTCSLLSRRPRRDEQTQGTNMAKLALANGQGDLESGLAGAVPYGDMDAHAGSLPLDRDPRLDPDSPGLELFYTKDIFECTADGRPVFCSPCGTWKPDRAHHSSEINRCVRKLDHFCPWTGGVVSETTFKFFFQFNFYAFVLCALTIASGAYALWRRKVLGLGGDARIVVAIALAGFFGLFAFCMTMACLHFVFTNLTNVESYQLKDRTRLMAVRIRRGAGPVQGSYNVVTYPLPKDDGPLSGYGATGASAPLQPQPENTVGPVSGTAAEPEEVDPIKAARAARAARRAQRDQRDLLAFRTFAIIPVEKGMNVWDLGWGANWASVMGTNPLDWLLPVRVSPCCDHDSMVSFYRVSPAFKKMCDELHLPACQDREQAPSW